MTELRDPEPTSDPDDVTNDEVPEPAPDPEPETTQEDPR